MRKALERLKNTFNGKASVTVPSAQIQDLAGVCYSVCEAIPVEARQDVFKGVTSELHLNDLRANGEKILERLGVLELNENPNHGSILARSLIDGLIRAHDKGLTAGFERPIEGVINRLMAERR